LNGICKSEKTMDLIGCQIKMFLDCIEYQFYDGMTWENQGSFWHLDHVKPCASFEQSVNNKRFASTGEILDL
jgi:hypothetical protein